MELEKYLRTLSLLLVLVLLSSCSVFKKPEKEIVIQTVEKERVIPVQAAPKPVTLNHIEFKVVTQKNFDEFLTQWKKEHGESWVFYVMSVRDYESMALNMAELRRYIQQQKEIIIYYEKAVTKNDE